MKYFSSFIFFIALNYCLPFTRMFDTLTVLFTHRTFLHTQRKFFFQKTVFFRKISHHPHLNNYNVLETQYMNKITFKQIQISSVNYARNRTTYHRIECTGIEQHFPSQYFFPTCCSGT
jgi:hypothetical protein